MNLVEQELAEICQDSPFVDLGKLAVRGWEIIRLEVLEGRLVEAITLVMIWVVVGCCLTVGS